MIEDCDNRIKAIDKAFEIKDFNKIKIEAHTMKGPLFNLGMDILGEIIIELENCSKNNDEIKCNELINEIKNEFQNIIDFVKINS